MSISLEPIVPAGRDRAALIEFFSTNAFPYHARAGVRSVGEAAEFVDSGGFLGDDGVALWVVDAELGRIGLVRIDDLGADTPEFDLRLAADHRGRGLGEAILRAVTDHLFTTTSAQRFEGMTRADNVAMRNVFVRAGWTKEAHHRRAWTVEGGDRLDAVAYAILREEWETGERIPVAWDDQPD